MLKKIFIFAFILFIIGAAAVWYVIYQKPTGLEPNANGNDNPFGDVSPDQTGTPQTPGSDGENNIPLGTQTQIQELTQVTTSAAAGAIFIESKASTSIRFMDRATSHITDLDLGTGKITRISNTTIPKIYGALWFNGGNSAILRYLNEAGNTINTYSANLVTPKTIGTSTTALKELQGRFLAQDIESIALSPAKTRIFYIITENGVGQGTIANTDGSKRSTIFTSPLTEWIAQWPAEGVITLTTKAAGGHGGYLYFLTTAGKMTRILAGVPGLTTLTDPSGTKIVYSDDSNNLRVYVPKTGTTLNTGLSTLAEKCVWSKKQKNIMYCAVPQFIPRGTYPDVWYQGLVSFADGIYKVNTDSNTSQLIANIPAKFNQSFDIVEPMISSDDLHFGFKNKKDGTIWVLRLASTTPQ